MKRGGKHTPEMRAALSAKMRVVMNSPDVKRRVSDGTKKGMEAIAADLPEKRALLAAWRQAGPWARKQFLSEILDPVCLDEVRHG
jgi:hypothetical protein